MIYRTSGADIKSVTISINKEGCNDISYAPFALFGGSTFSTGTIGKIDNTLKTGNVTIKCNDNGSIQNVNKIVVIPSSIHEMLFLPWDEKIDERYMDEMIQGVNDILVSPVEQLGNKSYIMEV